MVHTRTIASILITGLLTGGAGMAMGFSSSHSSNSILPVAVPSNGSKIDGPTNKPNCKCRANGRKYNLGESTCFQTNKGLVRALCVLVLNNTSWKILEGSCDTAFNEQLRSVPPKPDDRRKAASCSLT